MITTATNTLVLNTVIAETINKITHISLRNSSGEFFRKAVTDITDVTSKKKSYTFYLTETEGNGSIVEIGLHGNGATTTLNSGTCYATQPLVLVKDNTQSLNVEWSVGII